MLREPIDLPPIVSVELIQISDKTNIPFAPKARKIIEENNTLYESMLDKTTQSLEKIISNSESLSKIQ